MTELLGVAAAAAVLLFPGLAIVRAPWPAVPFLSAGFWIVSWWWLPASVGRHRFLVAALFTFMALAALRLLQPLPGRRPSWPVVLVVMAALARLLPFAFWPVAPGADMSLHSLSTLLLVWRDGLPKTYEPLLPIHTFGAYTPGLHALAADITLLSGLPAARAAFLVALAGHGLLQVSLFALLGRFFTPPVAALASVCALGMARVPQGFFGWGANPSVLALAFLAAALAVLLAPQVSRSAAVAAGLFLAATVTVHALMAALALLLLPWLGRALPAEAAARRATLRRWSMAALVALALAAPFLLHLDVTLSAGERAWLADHLRQHYAADWARYASWYPLAVLRYAIASWNDAFLIAAVVGFGLALAGRAGASFARTVPGALASLTLALALVSGARWGGWGWPVAYPERELAVVFLILAGAVGVVVEWARARSQAWLHWLVLLSLICIAAERTHRYYVAGGAAGVMVTADDVAAMGWLEAHTDPGEVVCNDYRTAGLWVPALAGRAISEPHLPPFYFDEFRAGAEGRSCRYRYVSSRWFFGPPDPTPHPGRVVFTSGSAAIVEEPKSHGLLGHTVLQGAGNLAPPLP